METLGDLWDFGVGLENVKVEFRDRALLVNSRSDNGNKNDIGNDSKTSYNSNNSKQVPPELLSIQIKTPVGAQ